jgi:outer membrane protein assembly factor BamD (BamD/ComL family)
VIPVLVGEAQMPRPDELPEALRPLARRNAVRLTHERFRADTQGLVKALHQALEEIDVLRKTQAEVATRAQAEQERGREEQAAIEQANALRESEEQARRDKEQARLTAIAGLSPEQIAKAEELANWEFIKDSARAQDFRDHLARFAHGVCERMARHKLEALAWTALGEAPDRVALASHLEEFPEGAHTEQAKMQIASIERVEEAVAEVQRRTEEEEHRKKAEAEEQERAAEERRRQEAAAKQHAEEERTFTAAKRVGTVTAIDAFLAAHPESHRVAEAQKLKAALLAREEAYRHAMASADSALLKSFLEIYQKGADADQVRTRLRRLEPKQSARPSAQTIIIPGALAIVLVAGLVVWFETRSSPNTQQVSAVQPAALPVQSAPVLSPAVPTALPASSVPPEPLGKVAESAPAPSPDEVAWSLLKETTDEAALKRFTSQYPKSELRKDAEARIAALEATQAAKPVPPKPDELTWAWLKDTTDEAALKRFATQYPNSALRKDAEARIAALESEVAKPAPANPVVDTHELARSLQLELKRVGCFSGAVNGEFDDVTKAAWHNFTKLTTLNMPDDVSADAIKAVRGVDKRVCPVVCPDGQRAEGDRCVAIPPLHKAEPQKAGAHTAEPQKDTGCHLVISVNGFGGPLQACGQEFQAIKRDNPARLIPGK